MTRHTLGALIALSLTVPGAMAQTSSSDQTAGRCSLVGQMAGSVWLEMIQSLGDGRSDQVDSAIARLNDLTAVYGQIGCDLNALNATYDCVLTDREDSSPRALLRQCMADAGIAGE